MASRFKEIITYKQITIQSLFTPNLYTIFGKGDILKNLYTAFFLSSYWPKDSKINLYNSIVYTSGFQTEFWGPKGAAKEYWGGPWKHFKGGGERM